MYAEEHTALSLRPWDKKYSRATSDESLPRVRGNVWFYSILSYILIVFIENYEKNIYVYRKRKQLGVPSSLRCIAGLFVDGPFSLSWSFYVAFVVLGP